MSSLFQVSGVHLFYCEYLVKKKQRVIHSGCIKGVVQNCGHWTSFQSEPVCYLSLDRKTKFLMHRFMCWNWFWTREELWKSRLSQMTMYLCAICMYVCICMRYINFIYYYYYYLLRSADMLSFIGNRFQQVSFSPSSCRDRWC